MMDPEYIYLLNGVVVNENHLKSDFYDCPGTPMVLYTGFVERIFSLFRNAPLLEDCIQNPETYLNAVNIVSIFLLVFILYYGGYFLYNRTKDIFTCLLVQSSIFAFDIVHYTSRVLAETVILFFLLIFIFQVIYYINTNSEENGNKSNAAVMFALTLGILTATKISVFPLFFIPLLLLKNTRSRLIYSGFAVLFFFIFAYPVLFNLNSFYKWMKSIFLHSGRYGSGDNVIISLPDFIQNLKTLFNMYRIVFYFLSLNLIVIVGGLFLKYREKSSFSNKVYDAIAGLTICIIIQTIIVGKHFALHYYLPVIMMIPLNVYLLSNVLIDQWPFRYAKTVKDVVFLIAVILIMMAMHRYVIVDTRIRYDIMRKRGKTINYIRNHPSDMSLVFNSEAWNPYQEMGLWFGSLFTRKYRTLFIEKFNEIYPNRYFYVDQWDCFIDWENNRYRLHEILSRHDSLLFFYNRTGKDFIDFIPTAVSSDSISQDIIFNNNETNEIMAKIRLTH
ncbi:MAG: hypothetical protein JXK95_09330 [Bacteroidales bacterium]|nr:hypothetical protein [Bacteroidales bacterium]